jgi:hypothetical protein
MSRIRHNNVVVVKNKGQIMDFIYDTATGFVVRK